MRWILTAVAAIAGYVMGGFGGMELAGEYAPEFELFGLKGYLAGLVLGGRGLVRQPRQAHHCSQRRWTHPNEVLITRRLRRRQAQGEGCDVAAHNR